MNPMARSGSLVRLYWRVGLSKKPGNMIGLVVEDLGVAENGEARVVEVDGRGAVAALALIGASHKCGICLQRIYDCSRLLRL